METENKIKIENGCKMISRKLYKLLPNSEALYIETWNNGAIRYAKLSWFFDKKPQALEF